VAIYPQQTCLGNLAVPGISNEEETCHPVPAGDN